MRLKVAELYMSNGSFAKVEYSSSVNGVLIEKILVFEDEDMEIFIREISDEDISDAERFHILENIDLENEELDF